MVSDCIWDVKALLGEAPLWCAKTNSLLFLDIESSEVLFWSEKNKLKIRTKEKMSAMAITKCSNLLVCKHSSIALIDLLSEATLWEMMVVGINPCNDPAESAHFKPLMQMPQRVFSCPAPDAGAVGYKSQSSHQ
jgi:sugar lactone lactonase YvrE